MKSCTDEKWGLMGFSSSCRIIHGVRGWSRWLRVDRARKDHIFDHISCTTSGQTCCNKSIVDRKLAQVRSSKFHWCIEGRCVSAFLRFSSPRMCQVLFDGGSRPPTSQRLQDRTAQNKSVLDQKLAQVRSWWRCCTGLSNMLFNMLPRTVGKFVISIHGRNIASGQVPTGTGKVQQIVVFIRIYRT